MYIETEPVIILIQAKSNRPKCGINSGFGVLFLIFLKAGVLGFNQNSELHITHFPKKGTS